MRSELLRGFAALTLFLVLIISTDLLVPYSVVPDGYTVVDVRRIAENSLLLEGASISSSATILSVTDHGAFSSALVEGGVTLSFPSTIGHPESGVRVLFRGVSWLSENGSITVHEFYVLDYSSSLIRSVPGIILFIIMFFLVFTFDFRHIAFIVRRRIRNA